MLSPPPTQDTLGKRKRDDDDESTARDTFLVSQDEDEGFDETSDKEEDKPDDKDDNADLEDDSDDDDDDDDEPDESTYNELAETFPNEPAYDADLPSILDRCTSTVSDIKALLYQSGSCSDAVRGFQEKAKEIETVPDPKPIKIGMLGDTGVGSYVLISLRLL